ncbi:MAG TPA: nucleotide exchange factor GrpE [Solirubrobacteraceae bacterium]|jgi:molecular chaperone GrpE|nr:nucleotide exchange factor GrpE [Solirubrobacteraceae bacterium]
MRDIDQTTPSEAKEQPSPAEQQGVPAAGQQPGGGGHPRHGAAAAGDGAAQLEGDLDELVKVAAQRDEYLALAQRTQADFENYRKRVARDVAGAQERGAVSLAKGLLPALDNLDRALEAAQEDDPLLDGVRLVRSELMAALARSGIEAFRPLGEEFDPNVHEAVATVPAPNGRAGTVVEVYQDGYRAGESVIRPARVVVGA